MDTVWSLVMVRKRLIETGNCLIMDRRLQIGGIFLLITELNFNKTDYKKDSLFSVLRSWIRIFYVLIIHLKRKFNMQFTLDIIKYKNYLKEIIF